MAIAWTQLTDGVSTSDPSNTASVTPSANAQVFVTFAISILNGFPTDSVTVSGCSLTWTKASTVTYSSRRRLWVYVGTGASPSTGAITIDYTGTGTYQETMWSVDEATGVNATTPYDTPVTGSVTSASSLALSSVGAPDSGDHVYAAFGCGSGTGVTLESGYTELTLRGSGANIRSIVAMYDGTAPIDDTPSITFPSSNGAGGIGFVINMASVATGIANYIGDLSLGYSGLGTRGLS